MGLDSSYDVEAREDGLLLKGASFSKGVSSGESIAAKIDRKRFIVADKKSAAAMGAMTDGFCKCSIKIFEYFLLGLVERQFCGMLSVDTGRGIKKLYFRNGELIFAGSDLMDDRLGEVIFRSNQISVDELTSSAVQVNREKKFGRVLLDSGKFGHFDLWNALCSQVLEILRSIFRVNTVYYHLSEVSHPPTMVSLNSKTSDIVQEFAGAGRVFRSFLKRLTPESGLELSNEAKVILERQAANNFECDFLSLIRDHPTIKGVVEASKLRDITTYATIFKMVASKLIEPINTVVDDTFRGVRDGVLQSKIDGFRIVRQSIISEMRQHGLGFPFGELRSFLDKNYKLHSGDIYLDEYGDFSELCLIGLHYKCQGSSMVRNNLLRCIDSIATFMLQIAVDRLPWESGKSLKQNFKEIII